MAGHDRRHHLDMEGLEFRTSTVVSHQGAIVFSQLHIQISLQVDLKSHPFQFDNSY